MNHPGNQRRMYLLALAMLLAAVALASAWLIWRGQPEADGAQSLPVPTAGVTVQPSATLSPWDEAASAEAPDADGSGSMVSTVVYYQDNDGYLVPVMCRVPMEDGIAKATLKRMVRSAGNDMQAARLGLRTVLPENMSMELDISGGLARIDLGEEALRLSDAAAETNMISAIVQTLTEFDTVEEVEFLIDGQRREKLPHGTAVAGRFRRGDINLEAAQETMQTADANAVRLYFPSEVGTVVVPVTRLVYSRPDINTAVLELAKGPSDMGSLESVLPDGCGLIDVTVEDGTARLNFTREFAEIALNSDGGRIALKALVLTCTQFEGVERVEIYVEGEKYDPGKDTLNVPTFANVADTIVYDYIQTQTAMLLGE